MESVTTLEALRRAVDSLEMKTTSEKLLRRYIHEQVRFLKQPDILFPIGYSPQGS